MVIRVKVPGSCGELLQGTKNGKPFLLTCPINQYSTVLIEKSLLKVKLPALRYPLSPLMAFFLKDLSK